jgi:hypothetical protein
MALRRGVLVLLWGKCKHMGATRYHVDELSHPQSEMII